MVTAVIPDIIFTADSISGFRIWYFQKKDNSTMFNLRFIMQKS